MNSTGNLAFPCPVLFCGNCDAESISHQSLKAHRNTFHSSNHTCFLCDSANGKLVENVNIKDHLKQVHGLSGMVSCSCCNYILKGLGDLRIHHKSLRCTGNLGIERILAKSSDKPGSLLQENLVEKYQMYFARTTYQMNTFLAKMTQHSNSSVPANPPVTTTSVSTCVLGTEDKKIISNPLANKIGFEKPCSNESGNRLPKSSTEKNKVYVARNTNQKNKQLAALAQRSRSSVVSKPPVTTSSVSTCVLTAEDKENISNPSANKVGFEEPWFLVNTPDFRHAQEFFQKYMLPVLIKFHEEKVAKKNEGMNVHP